jgi:hypothetical protein
MKLDLLLQLLFIAVRSFLTDTFFVHRMKFTHVNYMISQYKDVCALNKIQQVCYQLFHRTFNLVLLICIFLILMSQSSFPSSSSSLIYINSCSKSLLESDNYICESDKLWNERKLIYEVQNKRNLMKQQHRIFYRTNWESNFHCSHARRIDRMGGFILFRKSS